MNRRERARCGIADQDRDAVSSLYDKQDVRRGADERVTVLIIAEHPGFLFRFDFGVNDAHVGAVNLPAPGERPVPSEELEEAAAIFVNVFGLVFVETGEVQRVRRHRTDAAESRRKCICETVAFQRGAN